MARPGDRRPLITDHAISVLARGGARALTHQAVDRAAGLATGSTSYYFRSRRDLIAGTIERIRTKSRYAFDSAPPPHELTASTAAALMTGQIVLLTEARREEALSVFALVPELEEDPELRQQLTACLFSFGLAERLLTELGAPAPTESALNLIDYLTGTLFGLLFGRRHDGEQERFIINSALERFLLACLL